MEDEDGGRGRGVSSLLAEYLGIDYVLRHLSDSNITTVTGAENLQVLKGLWSLDLPGDHAGTDSGFVGRLFVSPSHLVERRWPLGVGSRSCVYIHIIRTRHCVPDAATRAALGKWRMLLSDGSMDVPALVRRRSEGFKARNSSIVRSMKGGKVTDVSQ